MPRPSLKEQRKEEILGAVERVVISDGISGVTLEKIATEANLRRSLLRHNVGNRDQLIEAFLERFFYQSDFEITQMLSYLPKYNRISLLLDFLFNEEYSNNKLALIAMALTSAALNDKNICQKLKTWNLNFISTIKKELQRSYPESTSEDCFDIASGIVGIYFNVESLTALGDISSVRIASKRAAEKLISTLEK